MATSLATSLLLLSLLLPLLHSASAQADTAYDAALGLPELSTYVKVLKRCPHLLAAAKNTSTTYTFFAPNNKAFTTYLKKLNISQAAFLKNQSKVLHLLDYHIGKEAYMMSIALTTKKQKMATLLPKASVTLQLVKNKLMVNTATIVEPDFPSGDSYLQVINQVLTPPLSNSTTKALLHHRRLM